MDDAASPNPSETDKNAETGGLSAWGKTFSSSKESYAERMEEYRSMYNPPAMDVGGADTLGRLAASPTPGVGDNPMLGSTAETDSYGAHSGAPSAFDSFNADGNSPSSSARFNGADFGSLQGQQNQNQIRPPTVSAFGGNSIAAQPAILPFPKKPGSLFQ